MYDRDRSRDYSRQRSRDREKKSHRSPSQSQDYRRHKHREQQQQYRFKSKRVKFEEAPDIKVFKKEDEPSAKGLSEEEIVKFKNQMEKQVQKLAIKIEDQRHQEAQNERRYRKQVDDDLMQQKDKDRALSQRLQSVQEGMLYSCPVGVSGLVSLVQVGGESQERLGHTMRINDILGCYYTSIGQIPDQPQFQLLNNNSSTDCKIIKFDDDHQTNNSAQTYTKKKEEKPLKGILKMPQNTIKPAQNRIIDSKLILLLKDIKDHPTMYPKEKMDQLLDPYKKSGDLPYLMKNPDILQNLLRSVIIPQNRQSLSVSAGRDSMEGNPQGNYSGNMYHNFVPKADKYRTVPCKYYHSHLGCNKIDNCTYIHDQRYAGVPVPPNYTRPNETNSTQPNNPPQPGMTSFSSTNVPRMPMYQGPPQGQPVPPGNFMMGNFTNPNVFPNSGYNRGGSYPTPNVNNFSSNNNPNGNNYQQQGNYPQNRVDNNNGKFSGQPPNNFPQNFSYPPVPFGYFGQPQQNQQGQGGNPN